MPSRRVLAALMLALPLGGSEPAMAAGDRQAVRATFTAVKPKASTGTRIEMTFRNPRDPSGKPYAVDDVVIVSPPGTRFDHDAIPKCRASDAELMLRGVAGCPSASKVQAGRMTLDTGSPLAVPRIMRFRTATFNASGGFVSVGDAENFPFRGVVRSRTDGRVTRVDYADAAGYGGPDSYSAMRTMLTSGPPLGTESRPFMRAPSSCPRRGRWTTRFIFIYHDGERATERTRSRCRRRRPERRLIARTAQ